MPKTLLLPCFGNHVFEPCFCYFKYFLHEEERIEILIVTLLLLKLDAVVALIAIKTDLNDPYNVLENWDINSVDPCSWRMITCSPDGYVSAM